MRTKPPPFHPSRFMSRQSDAATTEDTAAYSEFVAVVRRLRRECPWDREQTHASVKHLLIEEAYEAVEAIDVEDYEELKRELGDLLLHVVFHGVMAEEGGRFDLAGLIEAETNKLVRRHPHVFSDVSVGGVGDVLTNWERIKQVEGRRTSVLEGVPKDLPALLSAFRMQEKAAGVGFDFAAETDVWAKVEEEIREFREEKPGTTDREGEFGDLLFSLVNWARCTHINPENALRRSNSKFRRRFRHVEERLAELGRKWEDADLAEMDRYWEEAKKDETAE